MSGNYAQRKRRGLFLTPRPIALRLVELAMPHLDADRKDRDLSACDPFAGAGVLLAALAETLLTQREQRRNCSRGGSATPVPGMLHGVDVDGGALELAARSLSESFDASSESPAGNLKVADSLAIPVTSDSRSSDPSFASLFPGVFARGGFDLVLTNPPWEKVRVNDREFFGHYEPSFVRKSRAARDELRRELLARSDVASAYRQYRERIDALKEASKLHYETTGSGGDLDTYKLAVERSVAITRPGGLIALVIPHGLLGDWGARKLRRWLFDNTQVLEILRFETGTELFPEIHANLGVILLVLRKRQPPPNAVIRMSAAVRTLEALRRPSLTQLPLSLVAAATNHTMVPLVESSSDVELLEHCLRFPRLDQWPEAAFRARREVDMTNDRPGFLPPGGGGVPLIEGKHIGPFELRTAERRFDVEPERAAYSQHARIAWRAVADRAMKRRLIATWIPPNVALGNSLIFTIVESPQPIEGLLWLLAWMNSRIADAQLRLWCANNNINIFHIGSCRVPRLDDSPQGVEIIGICAGLVAGCTSFELPEPIRRRATPLTDADARREAIDAMDELWRQIYGLSSAVWDRSVVSRTAAVAEISTRGRKVARTQKTD